MTGSHTSTTLGVLDIFTSARFTLAWSSSNHPGSTRRQRKQREDILRRDPTCYLHYDCCTITSTIEDHVTPLAQGGDRWSYSNRRGACEPCHKRKTQSESLTARPSRQRTPEQHPALKRPATQTE